MRRILTPDEATELRDLVVSGGPDHLLRSRARRALYRAVESNEDGVRHPLGFLCVPLHRGSPFGLCLHAWSPSIVAALTTSSIHAHTWDLASYVLYGRIDNEVIGLDDTRAPTHRVCAILSAGQVDEIRPTARLVGHQVIRTDQVAAGAVYTLPAGVFHATRAQAFTATLVVAAGRLPPPEFALASLGAITHRVLRTSATSSDLRTALRELESRDTGSELVR